MMTDPYKDIPVFRVKFIEKGLNDARLLLLDEEDNIVGQLYHSDIRYEKSVKDRAKLWVSFLSQGSNTIDSMTF